MRTLILALALTAAPLGPLAASTTTASSADACVPLTKEPDQGLKPTTIETIGQAFDCVFEHYYAAPVLDHRPMLLRAFGKLTAELQRRDLDASDAVMPALTGDRAEDWAAFAGTYRSLAARVPADAQQALAAATMRGMMSALNDNHAGWDRPEGDGAAYGVGILGVSARPDDSAARGPLHITKLQPGSPLAKRGVRPGDIIVSVNGHAPFVNGFLVPSALDPIMGKEPVELTLRRPGSGRTWRVKITPVPFEPERPTVSAKRLEGDVAYVKVPGFYGGVADEVRKAIEGLSVKRGIVLDLRGNGGGSPREVTRLLGAFAHGKITSYFCDVRDKCTPNRTDDSVPLLGLPLTVLIDRECASACDDFSAAVKGLGLGTLVGTRTAGLVSGPGAPYLLSDGSVLSLPKLHHRGPGKEIVDTIGVPADHQVPTTAEDLAAGRDPALAKALELLP
ncbi:S41 family peptidase [Nonomuraea sp. NPDC050663]|uniref:S41 family peptidase n=1 Tax=Nonomuraea sp. NPDC050663 TaxID=3364370 RepID=UPI00379EC928